MRVRKAQKYVRQTYEEHSDMTFIIADYIDVETGEILSTEVIGLFHGAPSENPVTKVKDVIYCDCRTEYKE